MSKLGALSDAHIEELLPSRADQDQLSQLIAAVDAAAGENEKRAVFVDRLGAASVAAKDVVKKFGGTAIKLLV